VSQENVEVVRSVYTAYAERDWARSFALYAPDIEFDVSHLGDIGVANVYHGHDGVRACFRDLFDAFSTFDYTVESLADQGDHVLALVHEHGVGRASGVIIDRHHHAAWSIRDGKVVRMRAYLDRAEALKAVGLAE
jgi:uncharacterized protein